MRNPPQIMKLREIWWKNDELQINFYSSLYTICETNFWEKKVFRNQSTNSEQPSTYYLFIRHSFQMKIVSLQVDEYFFPVSSKTRLTIETAMKRLQRKIDSPKRQITVYTLFVFRLLFVVLFMFRRYLRIVYSGLMHYL